MNSDYGTLVESLRSEPQYSGGSPYLLASRNGTKAGSCAGVANPPRWCGFIFDRVWKITYPNGEASLEDLPQQLL
jgi:hypothetical protein